MMTTLNKTLTLLNYRVDPETNRVSVVEWCMDFTSPDFPGVTSKFPGLTPVDIDATGVTDADVLAAVQAWVDPHLPSIEPVHADHLAFDYQVKQRATRVIPVGTPEARRKLLPTITPRQLRLTLLSVGITEAQIDAALEKDPAGMVEWKYATSFSRKHPLIVSMGPMFSLTPEQVDSLWAYAKDL